jgi:hypothetical protein
MAHWHGLAKLRLHNDATLDVLDSVTKSLGDKLREFRDKTCSAFETRELKREYNARIRRTAKSTTAKHTPKGLPFEAHNPITTTTSSVSQAVTPQIALSFPPDLPIPENLRIQLPSCLEPSLLKATNCNYHLQEPRLLCLTNSKVSEVNASRL